MNSSSIDRLIVEAVRVVGKGMVNESVADQIFSQTVKLLPDLDASYVSETHSHRATIDILIDVGIGQVILTIVENPSSETFDAVLLNEKRKPLSLGSLGMYFKVTRPMSISNSSNAKDVAKWIRDLIGTPKF